MTDESHAHERYRGGGRESRDRWNRGDQYNATEHGADGPTAGDRDGSEPADRAGGTDRRTRPGHGHASTGHGGSLAGEPPHGRDAMEARPTGSRGERPTESQGDRPGLGGQSIEREGQAPTEIPAGSQRPAGEGQLPAGESEAAPAGDVGQPNHRQSDEQFGPDRDSPVTGTSYRQPYGQPVGRQGSDRKTRHARFQARRTAQERRQQFPTAGHDANREAGESHDRDAGESDHDDRRDQPRDPETGRFLPKDER